MNLIVIFVSDSVDDGNVNKSTTKCFEVKFLRSPIECLSTFDGTTVRGMKFEINTLEKVK